MNRARIMAGLALLVDRMMLPGHDNTMVPEGWEPWEWGYVKGIATAEIMRLHARILMIEFRLDVRTMNTHLFSDEEEGPPS